MTGRSEDPQRRAPSSSDEDPGEALETYLLKRDHAGGESPQMTAEGQLRGPSLDERLAQEQRGGDPSRSDSPRLAELDGPDDEPAMVAVEPSLGDAGEDLSPEEAAMHVRNEAPGWTDHPDDYVDAERPNVRSDDAD